MTTYKKLFTVLMGGKPPILDALFSSLDGASIVIFAALSGLLGCIGARLI